MEMVSLQKQSSPDYSKSRAKDNQQGFDMCGVDGASEGCEKIRKKATRWDPSAREAGTLEMIDRREPAYMEELARTLG